MVALNKLSLSILGLHPSNQAFSSILTQYNLLMVQFIDQTIFLLRILNEHKLISENEKDLNSIIEAIM